MAAKPATDLSSLTETAITYQRDLQMLPYATMAPVLGGLGISLYPGIQNKHVMTNFLRTAGIARPYVQGTVEESQVGKLEEKTLEIHLAYANVKDNIQNYKTTVVGPDVLLGKNRSKQHPWEMLMLTSIIRTFSEDILDALFHGVRNTSTRTALGCFNGYNKIIDLGIAASSIAANQGNYYATGGITAANAYDKLLAMWRSAHPLLKSRPSIMIVPYHIGEKYDDQYFDKYKYKPTLNNYGNTVLDGSNGLCSIVRTPYQGGGRVILTVAGNMHFGFDSMADQSFVQVRNPYTDPNDVQFWIQAGYGTRIQSFHKKVFMVNDQATANTAYSGDIIS
jgi:hypothetical protein